MAIIYTYPAKSKINAADSFLITDSSDSNNTKSLKYESFLKQIQLSIREITASLVSPIEFEPNATTEGQRGELRYWLRPQNEGTSYMYLCTYAAPPSQEGYYFWVRIPLDIYMGS